MKYAVCLFELVRASILGTLSPSLFYRSHAFEGDSSQFRLADTHWEGMIPDVGQMVWKWVSGWQHHSSATSDWVVPVTSTIGLPDFNWFQGYSQSILELVKQHAHTKPPNGFGWLNFHPIKNPNWIFILVGGLEKIFIFHNIWDTVILPID